MSIFLNPTDSSELYAAWDQEFLGSCELEVDGETKQATSASYITSLPESLLFSIVRAQHDATNEKAASKLAKRFEFEKTIFADRYLIENKEEAMRVRGEVSKIRVKIALLDNQLDQF